MEQLYSNHKRCPSCDYFAHLNEWTTIYFSSGSGYGGLICKEYDTQTKQKTHIGSVDLLSCPNCKTIIWNR